MSSFQEKTLSVSISHNRLKRFTRAEWTSSNASRALVICHLGSLHSGFADQMIYDGASSVYNGDHHG